MKIRIALIGNTCNNNFSIMRYFRTLGVDAHLLLYSDEGFIDSNPIHNPEWDTWCISDWSSFIHRLPIPNGIHGVVGRPDLLIRRPREFELIKMFEGYDEYIGSGISPALFSRMNKSLSIFYPYSTGVEWVADGQTERKFKRYNLQWPFRWYVKQKQISGMRSAKKTINPLLDHTQEVLEKYNIQSIKKNIPLVYNLENIPSQVDDEILKYLKFNLNNTDFIIFSHMRHHWVNQEHLYESSTWWRRNKHNDWLIQGFSMFLKKQPNAKLILVDWGKDAAASRTLCSSLNLDNSVIWLPLLQRRQIFWILTHFCDVAVGEFVQSPGALWASTGWEALAVGVPTMQSVNFDNGSYEKVYGHPLPAFMDVKSIEDVCTNLSKVNFDESFERENARKNREWFSKFSGIELAKDWLNLIMAN
jgi:glycosyltransferase involved in cell wall biosynthesis